MKKANTVGLTLRLPKKLKNEVAKKAKNDKRSLNTLIILVLENYTQEDFSKNRQTA